MLEIKSDFGSNSALKSVRTHIQLALMLIVYFFLPFQTNPEIPNEFEI